jgi:glycosyltransferase involved in cell wall biosynthesis
MKVLASDFDIFIADGGSTDQALDDSFLKAQGVRCLLVKQGPGKLSAQMRMGMVETLQQGYEGLIFIDGNNKDNPEAIPEFARKLAEGFDHVQGSRFIRGGVHKNTPLSRLLAVRLIHSPMISLASRFFYTDTTNGFRAYSRKFLLDARVQPFRDVFSTYELHYYLAIRAARLSFKVVEVPVERIYPQEGKVPTKIKGFKGNLFIMKVLLQSCLSVFDPKGGFSEK